MEALTEEEKKALRGSKFAPLPSSAPQIRSNPREAHPGGPMKTNKAVALAKFLERKLQDPNGLASVDPKLVELAVKNAQTTVRLSGSSSASERIIHHVDCFDDFEGSVAEEKSHETNNFVSKKLKLKKKKKKKKKEKKKVNAFSGIA